MELLDVLTVILIVLKLLNLISWSWWWILAPQWIPIVACLVVAIVIIIVDN